MGASGDIAMPIVLDHTIVPAYNNEASARFFARIFGLQYEASVSHFAPVRVNDTLVLDFDTRTTSSPITMPSRSAIQTSRRFFNGSSARASRTAAAHGHLTIWRLTTAVEDAGST